MGMNRGKPSMAIVRPFQPNLAELCIYGPLMDRFDLTFYFTGLSEAGCRQQLDSLGLQGLRAVRYSTYADFISSQLLRRAIDYKIGFGSYMLSHLSEVLRHDYINVVDPIYAFPHQIARSMRPGQKLIVVRWENIYGRYEKVWMATRRANGVFRRADFIICVSLAALHTLQVPEEFAGKISQIYPGIALGNLRPRNGDRLPGEVQANHAAPSPTILFVGRLNWTKGLHSLLVALSIVHRHWNCAATLRVIGGGDAKPYQKLARKLGLEKYVEFWGPMANEQVRLKMQEASLFCFPSLLSPNWMEQYGFALVEAMAHGLPVVAFDSGSIREICGEDGVYASAGNSYELAKGIAGLLHNKTQAVHCGQRLQRRVSELFDAQRQGQKLLELIQ